jgi:hypothetical protein
MVLAAGTPAPVRSAARLSPGTCEEDPKPFSEWIEEGLLGVPPPSAAAEALRAPSATWWDALPFDAPLPFEDVLEPFPALDPPPPPESPLRLPTGNTGAASRRPLSRGI